MQSHTQTLHIIAFILTYNRQINAYTAEHSENPHNFSSHTIRRIDRRMGQTQTSYKITLILTYNTKLDLNGTQTLL